MMDRSTNIYDLSFQELIKLLDGWNQPSYRAQQLWSGLYLQLRNKPEEFTSLPKDLRHHLAEQFSTVLNNPKFIYLHPVNTLISNDGETIKTSFSLFDGKQIEAVLMRYSKRRTLCISTQAGCAMGCVFCATGQMGFHRQLSTGEIVEQVLYFARQLKLENDQVTNVVIMGMGEPFHNYEATLAAIEILNDQTGFNLGARRFTISTVGLIPGIKRFTAANTQVNLAISLHAADDNLRSKLLPVNKKYPLDELMSTCYDYVKTTHRRISFEWALIQGVNDTIDQAHLLAKRLKIFRIGGSSLCHVNLIRLNPTKLYTGQTPSQQTALAFQSILEQAGIPCTIRLRRGVDIQASCGQLANN